MRQYLPHIILSLLICLFIYLFYRTEKTLVNQLFISLVSYDSYTVLKSEILASVPLNKQLVYSLPEGLWVFCITLTSRFFFLPLGRIHFHLILIPLFFAIGLEILQKLQITNGRFDMMDIFFSLFFWLLALLLTHHHKRKENILKTGTSARLLCAFSYGIVYLAHVIP